MKVTTAFLLVDDQDRAKEFYTTVLGFEVGTDFAGDGFRWLSLTASDGGAELVLEAPNDAGRTYLESRFTAGRPAFSFTLSNLEEFEGIRSRGAVVLAEPAKQEYGGTDALIDDTCGNVICLHLE